MTKLVECHDDQASISLLDPARDNRLDQQEIPDLEYRLTLQTVASFPGPILGTRLCRQSHIITDHNQMHAKVHSHTHTHTHTP